MLFFDLPFFSTTNPLKSYDLDQEFWPELNSTLIYFCIILFVLPRRKNTFMEGNYLLLSLIISGLFVLVAAGYYHLVAKPKKIRSIYVREFKKKGLRVFELPHENFSYPLVKILNNDGQKGDAFTTLKKISMDHDIIISNAFNQVQIIATSPELIKQFALNEQSFFYEKRRIVVENLKRVVGNGIVFAERQVWKRKRRILSKIFTFGFITSKHKQISEICERALVKAEKRAEKLGKMGEDGKFKTSILHFSGEMASEVVMEVFLGGKGLRETINGLSVADFLIKLKGDINKQGSSLLGYILGNKFFQLGIRKEDKILNENIKTFNNWGINYINNLLQEVKQDFGKNPQKFPSNIIEALYCTIKNQQKHNDSLKLSSDQIFQEFKNFHVGGTNSVSHYIQMAMIYMSLNPETFSKLRSELEKHPDESNYEHKAFKQMPYLDAILKETTRMYGPTNFNFARCAIKDHVLCGVPVFAGTLIKYNSMGIHFNPQYYKEPEKFRPQRWLNGECQNIDALKLIGFGVGNRTCIGKLLGIFQAKIAICMLLRRYESINLVQKQIKLKWRFNYAPENVQFQFIPRK